jgi:hypothetical protein
MEITFHDHVCTRTGSRLVPEQFQSRNEFRKVSPHVTLRTTYLGWCQAGDLNFLTNDSFQDWFRPA